MLQGYVCGRCWCNGEPAVLVLGSSPLSCRSFLLRGSAERARCATQHPLSPVSASLMPAHSSYLWSPSGGGCIEALQRPSSSQFPVPVWNMGPINPGRVDQNPGLSAATTAQGRYGRCLMLHASISKPCRVPQSSSPEPRLLRPSQRWKPLRLGLRRC